MRILALREIPDDECLRDQWDALVEQMERPEVFYTYEWAVSVQRAYRSVISPLLLLGYDDHSLIGVAALAIEQNGKVSFLAGTTADYCDLLSLPDLRRVWCESVFCELRKSNHRSLTLANLPADSTTASVLVESARRHGYRSFTRPAYRCARIILGSDEDRASLRRRTTGKKMLRRLRSLSKQGPTVFSENATEEQIEQVVADFSKAHVATFLSTGRLSNMIRRERRDFLHELALELSKRGWLSINRLLVGDDCVAWNYGFQFAGCWFWYQPTFNTKYERVSPGFCLLGKIIEAACDNSEISVVDLGLGAEEYKERFANGTRQTLHTSLSSSAIRHARTVLRYRAAELIKALPKAELKIRAAVSRFSRVKSYLRDKGFWASARLVAGRLRRAFAGREEVHFFQWCGTDVLAISESLTIRELNSDLLGVAAIEYSDDQGTLAYLLRAARRLRTGGSRGFALVTLSGTPVHFCWVGDFEGFKMQELAQQLRAPSPKSILLFDCWTPLAVRGRNHFAKAIRSVASRLWCCGETAWIFGAAENHASLRGIEKAGFTRKFTMRRRNFMGLARTVQMDHEAPIPPAPVGRTLRDYAHSEN